MLRNEDGVRGFQLRRTAIDVLKALRDDRALAELRNSRDALTASLVNGTVRPDDVPLASDLLARLEAAITPYFD